ncbi:helix-turn-helix domain-containing protein [Haloarchaeobius iranensis]|uniref:Predicted DNA binding protein, contains HTH domain n=1 Tax=Haloarchaeobius iranensis TaxID=996166 RepID=A0A1G9XZK4_9EURY|nr:helix-turn-helix domain-containing protein [Haloarchaeobius iranensis]SDN02228.1 Predicted DNA binding protein, contains HTH domain [Haloarchaeobius iranensis]
MQSLDVTLRLPDEARLPAPEWFDLGEDFVREELLAWHTDEDRGVDFFLALVVGDIDATSDALAELDAVYDHELVPVDDDTFYAYAEMAIGSETMAWRAAFDDQDIVLVPPVVFGPHGSVQLTVLGDPDALRNVVDGFPDFVRVDIERVGEPRGIGGSLAGRLTARQFEALSAAWELGYYEVPREGSLSEVAASLGCSESAASTLLRKAERGLVDATLG